MLKKNDIPAHFFVIPLWRVLFSIAFVWSGILSCWLVASYGESYLFGFAAIVLVGVLQYHLNVIGHDGLHFNVGRSRSANDLVCRFLLHGPLLSPLSLLRKNHLSHHAHLGGARDNDRHYYEISRFGNSRRWILWLISSLLGGMTFQVVRKLLFSRGGSGSSAKSPINVDSVLAKDLFSIGLTQLLILALLWFLFSGVHGYLVFWLLPMFTVMFGLNVVRSCLEHAVDVLDASRYLSFRPAVLERFFLSPYNMNFHAEHHFYPTVPMHHLPAFGRFLRRAGVKYDRLPGYMSRLCYLSRVSSAFAPDRGGAGELVDGGAS
ncbi:fatty acid desaturase [Microbulbifer salipaludis]|uniref:Fatty acid desaturase n=1 Tax=Microbulbifer salipaludis TaxID=187980 RepID=A0ABS3E6D6_9GAMM|nr:fatty acid desaturase [Microbulbifer salipaludis]MBN8430842.1 fatty acid desaturase [Microbulbifer salipaludis]